MKNFEDILNTEQKNEEVIEVETKSPIKDLSKPEVNTEDALAKFKKHKKNKTKNVSSNRKFVPTNSDEGDIETIETAIEVVDSAPSEEIIEPVVVKKQSPQRIKVVAVPKQEEVIVEKPTSSEEQLSFSINMDVLDLVEDKTEVEENVVQDVVEDNTANEPIKPVLVVSSEDTEPVEQPKKVVIKPVVADPVINVEEVIEDTQTSADVLTTEDIVVEQEVAINIVEEEQNTETVEETFEQIEKQEEIPSVEQKVEEIPSNEPVEVKTSNTKKGLSKFNKLKNVEYKTALKYFVGAVAVAIIAIAVIALSKGVSIVPVDNEGINTAKIQPNNQVVVIESDDTILLKKSLNEGLPVNYYTLLNSEKSVQVPNGYIAFENIFSNTIPNLVTTTEVNGREQSNTAVFSTWAIKSKDNTLLETNRSLIEDVISITLEGKDLTFFSSEAMMSNTISFAVERIIGQEVEVKNIQVLHNFKK